MIDVIDHGPVRELRLARPPANALDRSLLEGLRDAVQAAPRQGAHAIVLSGLPGMFSGGLDVPYLIGLDRDQLAADMKLFFTVMQSLAASPIPIVAAITGHSPAGGAVLALFCDRRVMADGDFVIGLNEVHVGIPMPRSIAAALTRLVGPRRAEELCVTGALLDPHQALETGLVDEVVPVDEVVAVSVTWCERLLKLPQRALRGTRASLRADLVQAIDDLGAADQKTMVEEWFEAENQRALGELVGRLTERS